MLDCDFFVLEQIKNRFIFEITGALYEFFQTNIMKSLKILAEQSPAGPESGRLVGKWRDARRDRTNGPRDGIDSGEMRHDAEKNMSRNATGGARDSTGCEKKLDCGTGRGKKWDSGTGQRAAGCGTGRDDFLAVPRSPGKYNTLMI